MSDSAGATAAKLLICGLLLFAGPPGWLGIYFILKKM